MNPSETQRHSQEYLERCRHPQIQALRPDTEDSKDLWIPTSEQLHELLTQKLPYPDRSVFRRTADGWEYETYFREWAVDYGTYIDTHRQFVGTDAESVSFAGVNGTPRYRGAMDGVEKFSLFFRRDR